MFADVVVRLSALLAIAPEIAELDLNPLLGTANSVIAVDARVRIEQIKEDGYFVDEYYINQACDL